jgi:septal ring factor EnvC (AmiA/AmiB activator)
LSNDEVQNLSNSQLINTNNELNNKITLETVWKGIASLQSSISNISHSLDTVSVQLNTFDPRIKELETSLNTMKSKTINFDNVQNDVNGLKQQVQHLLNELENIKSNHQVEKNLDYSDIFCEIREREIKSKNIIIYNVTEDNLRISQDYSTLEDINKFNDLMTARDNSRAREILDNIPDIDLDEVRTKRIGRTDWNTCRPLRVMLQCSEDVITVMKNRGLINQQYNVRTDQTKLQRKKIKELKEELAKINFNVTNPQMTIKFINGEPKIVPIRRNFMKNEQ